MPPFRRLFHLSLTKRSIEQAVDDEMRFHIQMRVEELMQQGRSVDDARAAAVRAYGDINAARDEIASIDRRSARQGAWRESLSSFGQDVRFGLRGLRRRPGFAVTVLMTLALGIGANAAIFNVVDTVLVRPLPFSRPDRLVHLWEVYESKVDSRSEASYPDYFDWRARNRVFSDIAGYQGDGFLLGADVPTTVGGARATANFFDVLGVRPFLGRTFISGEDALGAAPVVLLTYGLWETRFGADRGIVGRRLIVDGAPATVVGVLPPDFRFARTGYAEMWAPMNPSARTRQARGNHGLNVVGRLHDGVSLEAASQNMSAIMRDLAAEYPPTNAGRDAKVVSLRDELVGSIRPLLLVLYGAVAVVLLVACANVANLLLMRAADRQREMAVRIALGAGRARLVRQLLTESLLLAAGGGVIGLGVAQLGVHALVGAIPAAARARMPSLDAVGVDLRVALYSCLISLAAGVLFGLAPALRAARPAIHDALKQASRGSGVTGRLRDTLVVGEIGLTIILLSGTVLFGRSLFKLLSVDIGFRPERLITAGLLLPNASYGTRQRQMTFFDAAIERTRTLPGVQSVGLVSKLPLDFGNSTGFDILGRPPAQPGKEPTASYRTASPGYFATMGISLVSGRAFGRGDDAAAPKVAIVNRAFARAYFDRADAVGQSLIDGRDTTRIVGVVADVPIGKLEDRVPPTLYVPFAQDGDIFMRMVIRTTRDEPEIGAQLQALVHHLEPSAAIVQLTSMDALVTDSDSVFLRRFPLLLVGCFAATALTLAIIGIYGVVSYSVAQRTREMGIRMALGADPRNLVALVVLGAGRMAVLGIAVGVTAAILLARLVAGLLYGVASSDPATYVAVSILLALVAIAATIVPARRATLVDPALALRAD